MLSATMCCFAADTPPEGVNPVPSVTGDAVRELDLRFAASSTGRTELMECRVSYPWSVTQPFYEDPSCPGLAAVVPQSCNGGLYADDRLRQRIQVNDGGAVMLSTQGATRVHRQRTGAPARSDWELCAGPSSRLEAH